MRPTFMGFETAKSAVFTNQKAIDIVGNNLANIDTNGYTRQRVDVASRANSSFSSKINSSRVGMAGQGVEALGVSQMRDNFLDKRFRDEYGKSSYHGQAANILSDLQSSLIDGYVTDTSGMLGGIEQLYKSLIDFAGLPCEETQANIVMSSFKNITQVLQQINSTLNGVAQQQTYDTGLTVDRVNEISAQIANLNNIIAVDSTVTSDPNNEHYRPNELYDQRNLLLDELSGYGDVSVTHMPNGMVNVQMAGMKLVQETESTEMRMTQNTDGTINIKWLSSGEAVQFSGGSLKASVEFINGRGSNMQNSTESPQKGIPYYRDRMDTFAKTLGKLANNTIPLDLDMSGNPVYYDENDKPLLDEKRNSTVDGDGFILDADGKKIDDGRGGFKKGKILYKTLISSESGTNYTGDITAANISLSGDWTNGGAKYLISNKNISEPKYIQKLAYALTEGTSKFSSYGETFDGNFDSYVRDYLSTLGSDVSFQLGRQESLGRVADDFISRRDEVSGVSRDEETSNMLTYQKSYEAAARLMTTLDELLDVVINRMGRVGL